MRVLDQAAPDCSVRVSGLDQPMFEHLVRRYGGRIAAINFWKCPRIEDLTPLEDLPHLRWVSSYWNQRVSRLWDFRRTPRLQGLAFEDFRKVTVLDDLTAATSLQELVFGDVIERKSVVESLQPLADLTRLRRLEFTPRKVQDGRIEPLASLKELEQLNCPTNLFTSRQLAWLRARLPSAEESRVLKPLIELKKPIGDNDVLLVGKGKPFLNSATHAGRIAKHVTDFERMVREFEDDPTRPPAL